MYISMNWISDFVDLTGVDVRELIGRFTLSTAEVEDIYTKGDSIQNVVVGEIMQVSEHPNSKKLHLLKVNIGEPEYVDCVCGAPNVFVGAHVPFAKLGGRVGEMEIAEVMLAGEVSRGMCCSEKELGISEDHSGLLILDNSHKPGTDIKTFLPLDDIVFEVDNKSLTNRPDLWGHYGIAREIAALANRTLLPIPVQDMNLYEKLPALDIRVENKEKTFRYTGITIENITQKVSPLSMKIRLTYCGMRPINLLADLTNYLMLELGQPMHAFDNAVVKGICVKTFDEPFTFTTLDDVERKIDTETLMICDNTGAPACIAGIMGGALSCITDETTSVLLESANFDGVSVRKSASGMGMRTDASARYEKTLDPEMTVTAAARFVKLLLTIDNGAKVTSSLTDVYVKKYENITITFDKAYVDKYTGIDISSDRIEQTLTALGFAVMRDKDAFTVLVPSYRATKDVTMKADIIEEITRIYGYDNFEIRANKTLLAPVMQESTRTDEYRWKLFLADRYAMSEVHSYIWYDAKLNKELGIKTKPNVRIINSLASDSDTVKSTLIPTLLGHVSKNADAFSKLRIFEVGRVAEGLNSDGLCNERRKLGIVMADKGMDEETLFFALKEVLETTVLSVKNQKLSYERVENSQISYAHPANIAAIYAGGKKLGILACVHPQVRDNIDKKQNIVFAEIDLDVFDEVKAVPVMFTEVSKYPTITVDLSFIVENTMRYAELSKHLDAFSHPYLKQYSYVGSYEDEAALKGKKSVTVRFEFGSQEKTLTQAEINAATEALLAALAKNNIVLR